MNQSAASEGLRYAEEQRQRVGRWRKEGGRMRRFRGLGRASLGEL